MFFYSFNFFIFIFIATIHLTRYCNKTSFSPLASFHCLLFFPFLTLCPPYSVCLLSVLPTSSALRSCSTGDSLLSSAFIRSAKSAPALAPPPPVLLHHHHPLLPPLADQLAGTHSLHCLLACLLLCLLTLLVVLGQTGTLCFFSCLCH